MSTLRKKVSSKPQYEKDQPQRQSKRYSYTDFLYHFMMRLNWLVIFPMSGNNTFETFLSQKP